MAFTAQSKIKKVGKPATPFELRVAKELYEIGVSNADLKLKTKSLYIVRAKEVEISKGKSAALVFIPFRSAKGFREYQAELTTELEKKLGLPVVVVAHRKIIAPKGSKVIQRKQQKRPISRTLTSVYEAYLEDIVYPAEIIDKRTRVKTDGKKLYKVYLNPKHKAEVGDKLEVFSAVNRALTGRETTISFD
jgi:small subunit ribosomal protein S7e